MESCNEELTLQPEETITIATRSISSTATFVAATLNVREDN